MCTNFKITTTENDVVVGRSQEFSFLLSRSLMFRKPDHVYEQNLFDPSNTGCLPSRDASEHFKFSWKGKYGFVAMDAVNYCELDGTELANGDIITVDESIKDSDPISTDGMNTEGLYVGSLLQNQAIYPKITASEADKGLAITNVVDYILSSCKDCADVRAKLEGPDAEVIIADATKGHLFKQHFPVHDQYGNSIVIEFINGKTQIHDNNDYGVLTNDPDFEWHQTNIKHYANITPFNHNESLAGNLADITIPSQGNGFSLLPGGPLPMHRFIRAVMMVNYIDVANNIHEAINQAAHILNTVDIPKGIIREGSKTQKDEIHIEEDYTQYITVSDLSQKKFYVRLYGAPQMYSVDLRELDLNALNGKTYNIPQHDLSVDLTSQVN